MSEMHSDARSRPEEARRSSRLTLDGSLTMSVRGNHGQMLYDEPSSKPTRQGDAK